MKTTAQIMTMIALLIALTAPVVAQAYPGFGTGAYQQPATWVSNSGMGCPGCPGCPDNPIRTPGEPGCYVYNPGYPGYLGSPGYQGYPGYLGCPGCPGCPDYNATPRNPEEPGCLIVQ
ncbi:hypothetical protein [Methanocella arvoryzae]|uniref:Uncharacterized protein n=1 Tax=Methanocella arvoryzae (strain DSM 22066 / NBRC 105507 / MRE50) TaxID=351160 RepID=Q0W2I5_METAR|nr:hypothetical protein [Methanocella arvoryzae]CAJ37408.1 hypothetical protein RCIX2307 [Methanocella arvoryzae MRE50]